MPQSGHDASVRIALVHNPGSGRGSDAAELAGALRAAGATEVTTRAIRLAVPR